MGLHTPRLSHRGSAEHDLELRRLHCLLSQVWVKVDTLVIGNEPFLESKPSEKSNGNLNTFYEAMAAAVITFRNKTMSKITTNTDPSALPVSTKLFMGALNRLHDPTWRTPAVERMLDFIASTPELEGVDIHMHTHALAGHRNSLAYVLPRLRKNQTFLVTEFSVIWHWHKHMSHPVSKHYCSKHGLPKKTTVLDVINASILQPISYPQWEDFLKHKEWVVEKKSFLPDAVQLYRETGRLEVATYCWSPMMDRKKPLREEEPPWMLYGVYCPPTVKRQDDGGRWENFIIAEQFRRLQMTRT